MATISETVLDDAKAIFKLSYGLFVLTTKSNNFDNGCIINTVMQVTDNPKRIIIAVNKNNKTNQMIKESGVFNVSILDNTAVFGVFKHFGFQSGSTVDKFADFDDKARSKNGVYYLTKYANAVLSAKVVEMHEYETHTEFVGLVDEMKLLNDEISMTYQYYFDNVKPKPNKLTEKKKGWICKICGYVYEGEQLPDDFICPLCKHPASDFEKIV